MSADWLRLDERTNALDNLEMCDHFLRTLPHPIRWKWAIVALHQALYGFAIAAIQRGDALSVLTHPENPNSYLISIWEAIRRAKDPDRLSKRGAPLTTSHQEDRAIGLLVREFRNGFEHFVPSGWSIEVTGMPRLLAHVLRVIRGIAVDTQSVVFDEILDEERLHSALSQLEGTLKAATTNQNAAHSERS